MTPNKDAQPGLAESWTQGGDGLTWTITLRQDAAWSDGTPITAQTVVDSWLRAGRGFTHIHVSVM